MQKAIKRGSFNFRKCEVFHRRIGLINLAKKSYSFLTRNEVLGCQQSPLSHAWHWRDQWNSDYKETAYSWCRVFTKKHPWDQYLWKEGEERELHREKSSFSGNTMWSSELKMAHTFVVAWGQNGCPVLLRLPLNHRMWVSLKRKWPGARQFSASEAILKGWQLEAVIWRHSLNPRRKESFRKSGSPWLITYLAHTLAFQSYFLEISSVKRFPGLITDI